MVHQAIGSQFKSNIKDCTYLSHIFSVTGDFGVYTWSTFSLFLDYYIQSIYCDVGRETQKIGVGEQQDHMYLGPETKDWS